MKFSVEWLEDATNAAPEERATTGDLRITIANENVTFHLFEGSVPDHTNFAPDHVTVALYGLAHGIAHDWWRIFGSRDQELSILRYRNGFVLPDIRFRFDGAAFEIEAFQKNYGNPGLRFWGGFSEVKSREEGEAELSKLVEDVLARLSRAGVGATSAALRWERVKASRASSDATFCEAAGGLGLDPYEIDDGACGIIESAENIFERDALVEFLAGARGVDLRLLLEWVERMRRDRGSQYRLANLTNVANDAASRTPSKIGEKSWANGYRRARAMRSVLGIYHSDRYSSFQDLAKKLGAGRNYNLAPQVDGIRALTSKRPDGAQVHLRNQGESVEAKSAHLFAIARAIGDAACFPKSDLGPINDVRNAYRQAAGRAFAAEFLAPIDEIRSMRADKHDFATIANEFCVSTAVIERQLENEQRIREACA